MKLVFDLNFLDIENIHKLDVAIYKELLNIRNLLKSITNEILIKLNINIKLYHFNKDITRQVRDIFQALSFDNDGSYMINFN